jgi:hypothetical protein
MHEDKQKKEPTGYLGGRIPQTLHRRFMALLKIQGVHFTTLLTKWVEEYMEKHRPKGRRPPNG